MGDFFLDFRELKTRRLSAARAGSLFKFCSDTEVRTLEHESFSLVLSRVDGFELWGPFEQASPQGNTLVALAGRVALEESQWEAAAGLEAPGGLACKAIMELYRHGGIDALKALNGNFVVFIQDEPGKQFHIVTDRCGMFLAYGKEDPASSLVFASHPDVLAELSGESQAWDMASLAEFLMTSKVSFPYTYYQNLRALEPGSVFTIDQRQSRPAWRSPTRYFQFTFKIDAQASEEDLAEELAAGLKNAVRRRTLPIFGCTGVGLSGGLDSRAILSAVDSRGRAKAFTLFDEENAELSVARAIAEVCEVELVPIKRDFDYYANSAELGTRVSGGTGCFSCNHFLGVRHQLKEAGITNVLTGCYCDYLFKGLAYNRRERWLSRSEQVDGFQFEFYDSFYWLHTPAKEAVMARLRAQFPESTKTRLSEEDWLAVECKRTFPLAYEQDLAQRVIPQRLMPWFVPAVDNDLIAAYLKMPPRFKLNAVVFKKMLPLVCHERLCRIPDNNTGSKVNTAWPNYALARCFSAVRTRVAERLQPRMATAGSWPNWQYYFQHSEVLEALWSRPNPTARNLLTAILGSDPFRKSLRESAASELILFQRLLTLKLWLDQRQ